MLHFPVPAQDVLPHAPPMLCINALVAASRTTAEAVAHLHSGHILLDGGAVTEAGFIELAAQTAGAMKGYWEKTAGRPIGDGYLAAVGNFTVFGKARLGETLNISIELLTELSDIRLIEAHIRQAPCGRGDDAAGSLLASGKLKLFVPELGPKHEKQDIF
ncbi:MAG: hypothetical protein LBC94_02005 [Desulfovibrio sp.]|jgi:predicted hotdog family 3-hydroxylacyl-ACP dehydratase|nr:hypothetical protein [Desulfovibrio sp.]